MKLAAAVYLASKIIVWTSTFAVLSLLLEVNSAGDRAIQNSLGLARMWTRQTLDYVLTLLF